MNLRNRLSASWRSALGGAALCVGLGFGLLWLGGWPVYLGYDLLFLFPKPTPSEPVAIIYMDDESFRELGQFSTPNWDRKLHAQLLDRLTADHAKLVVFDVVFSEPGTSEANRLLAEAIKRNGKVVLATALSYPSRAQIKTTQSLLPLPEFQDVAAACGIAVVDMESSPGRIARQYYFGNAERPGLPLAAAVTAGLAITNRSGSIPHDWWLNYYGPALSLPHFSYCTVTNQPKGYFQNKYVFVGARPTTLKAQDEADQFRTPYTLWRGEFSPGVEIGATAFLNLLRNDGFTRLAPGPQWFVVLLTGLFFGGGLRIVRPRAAALLAILGVIAVVIFVLQAARHHIWFAWTVIALAQIPGALAWTLRCQFHRLKFQKEVLERTLVETVRLANASRTAQEQPSGPVIPDHTLLRRVGKGAYGEVWLARNAIGVFHAVKIVQRREFPSDEPYEREFRGMQKFMPISRSHAGFVNVLHVGRNDQTGFFFYIMEVCDDATTGQKIDPEHYSPKTLATELAWRGKLRGIL